MNKEYYIGLDNQMYGVYSLEQMRDFGLYADTLVLASGEGENWKPVAEYPELADWVVANHTAVAPETLNNQSDIFSTNFYYRQGEQLYGPFSVYELWALDIQGDTLLGINNTTDWRFAGDVENLMEALQLLKEGQEEEERKLRVRLDAEAKRNEEIRLSNEELKEVIEEQEKDIMNLEIENIMLKTKPKEPKEDVSKEALLRKISEFGEKLSQESGQRFTISYPSFSNELLDKVEKYNHTAESFIGLLNSLSNKTQKWLASNPNDFRAKNEILSAIRNLSEQFYKQNPALAPNCYETGESNHTIWTQLQPQPHRFPASSFLTGKNVIDFTLFDDLFSFTKYEYATFLDTKNIVAYYDKSTKQECFDFVNTLTARLFMSSLAGKFFVTTIDAQEMEGVSDLFKSLNKSVFFYSREPEIQKCLERKMQDIENIIQNPLLHPIKNIGEYNQGKENPESYQLIIIKAFPVGTDKSFDFLRQIMKNGQRAGVHIILLIDEDELANNEKATKDFESFKLDKFKNTLLHYDFTKAQFPFTQNDNIQHFTFEKLSVLQIRNIVRSINESLELKPAEVVSFANYVPSQTDWWKRNSGKQIEIPFGISEEKELVSLQITQESGQNSAIVIGIPGSGKSVFLHSIIANAIFNYSPEELSLYLMDFSGVEFNTYALHTLPHAKVIAPEAEREFGLSVLRELKEEGSRRMEFCRNNEVSNIVDLRAKCPDIKIPRVLVVIDEFQKLFEIENDSISREASSIIHIIIKEFRKFGINLILATQKMSDINGSILPKDLIANRVVFKCSPTDVNLIGMNVVPQLRAGECIYNAESGVAFVNKKVQTFFISKTELDEYLKNIKSFGAARNCTAKDTRIFRSDELPDFRMPNIVPQAQPDEVDIYFGQPIAISEYDVSANLRKSSNDNILIIGGEQDVAQKLAVNATLSIMAAHTDNSAKLYFFNFMRPADPLYSMPSDYYAATAFDTVFASKTAEVTDCLQSIKTEIDARKADENKEQSHIYLSFYAFQLAQMFKKGGRRGDDVSEAGQLLSYILNNGPLVGVFTILQVDNVPNLLQTGDVITYFSHRIALQMDEKDSQKIVTSDMASRLYVMNRPSSKFRCYYFNPKNRVLVKFKPYKLKS